MVESLKNITTGVDHSRPDLFPDGYPLNSDIAKGVDGLKMIDKTVMNLQYAIFHSLYQAGLAPDQSPENKVESQFYDSLIINLGDVGTIVSMQGDPLPHARLLELNGQTIDITERKYRFLKQWFDLNKAKYKNFSIDKANINTVDPLQDRAKWITDINNPNNVTLPHPYQHDTLKTYINDDSIGQADNGENKEHNHAVDNHDHLNPAHLHDVNDHDHVVDSTQVGGSHTHDKGTFRIIGKSIEYMKNNDLQDIIDGAIKSTGNASQNADRDRSEFHSGRIEFDTDFDRSCWSGETGEANMNIGNIKVEEKKGLKTKNKQAFKTGLKAGLNTKNQGSDQNIASGILVKKFIKF